MASTGWKRFHGPWPFTTTRWDLLGYHQCTSSLEGTGRFLVYPTIQRESEDAQAFFQRMEQVDQLVAQAINKAYEAVTRRHNTKPEREPFPPGALVWVYKAPDVASQSKLDARWRGPFVVKARTGNHSYLVADKRRATFGAHVDQLQAYTALGDPGELAGLEGWDKDLEKILTSTKWWMERLCTGYSGRTPETPCGCPTQC